MRFSREPKVLQKDKIRETIEKAFYYWKLSVEIETRAQDTYVPRLLSGWQLLRPLGVPGVLEALKYDNPGLSPGQQLTRLPEILEVFRLPKVLKSPGVPEYNDPRPYSILLLYSLTYDNGLLERVDNYTILLPRYYINSLIDSDKINKFFKIWANQNKWTSK